MSAPSLSVVVPVFNEARVLAATIREIRSFLEDQDRTFEAIFVDDGSTDSSWEILERAAEEDRRIRAERRTPNRGKGAAVREGMLAAEGELVFFMDADLSTPLDEIPGFVGALESGYDVVIGNRRAPGSQVTRRQPWLREKLGRAFTIVTRLLLAPGVHDFTCGFKGFQREAAAEIFRRTTQTGWAFDAEVVVIAQELGLKLAQVPVAWHDEAGTKVRLARAIPGSLVELVRIRRNRARGLYR